MERHFDELLAELKNHLVRMCALAEMMIADAEKLLVSRDASVIRTIKAHEEEVNRLQVEIDERCLTLIALHQPAASDLRFILGVAKTNTDLERLADEAINIAEKAEELLQAPALSAFVIIPQMATLARRMLKDSLHAYINRDLDLANRVLLRDDELDDLKDQLTEKMAGFMEGNPASVKYAVDIILIGRYLERIGDHATNIAENIIFVVEGRDVRHHGAAKTHP